MIFLAITFSEPCVIDSSTLPPLTGLNCLFISDDTLIVLSIECLHLKLLWLSRIDRVARGNTSRICNWQIAYFSATGNLASEFINGGRVLSLERS
ncbi:MAG: hypothetical protein CL912_07080 [Deltaproteobacteria bacterium]|nr:hypothetical protein [Deltaproteobacteria bacterium]